MTNPTLPKKQIPFPFSPQLKTLFSHLLKNGDELRLVGGIVRDFLSNKDIKNADFDLACQYTPEKTISILENKNVKTFPSGIKHGTITAVIDGQQFQITTLRADIENFGRHSKVEFISDFFEDAKRRDFTINALSIDQNGNLYDYFNGINDLQDQIVKFIGDAETRIKEDYLRILRFFRFSCFYAKDLDPEGLQACTNHKNHIKNLSSMRTREEFFKLFKCQNREKLFSILKSMFDCGVLELIFDSIDNKKIVALKNLFDLEKSLNCRFETVLFLAVMLGQKDPHLNLSNLEKKYLKQITSPKFVINFKITEKYLLKLMIEINKKELRDSYIIHLALDNNFENFVDDFLLINKIIDSSKIPAFPVNGNDLLNLKISPFNIGKTLKIAKNYWRENDFAVDKKTILSFIEKK